MEIRNINSEKDLYDLMYEIEEIDRLKDIEYIRLNRLFTPLDMEITTSTHNYEKFFYHHFVIEIEVTMENEKIINCVVEAAEDSYYLRGFQYVIYIKEPELNKTKEIHLLINNVALRGELFSNRVNSQKDFLKLLKEKLV